MEKRAGDVKRAALALVLIGMVVAAVISWFLSGLLVRPVEAVVRAAHEIEEGYLEARVPRQSSLSPVEFQELGAAFNFMARDIGAVMLQHDRVQNELRQAHDELELRVQERTRELTEEISERKKAEASVRLSEGRFRGAIESMQEGFALFDADDKLVALNDVYRQTNPGAQEVFEKGGTFEDLIRFNVERGVIKEAHGREEDFIRERVELHKNPKGPIIRRFTDGSWFMLVESKTPEGGIALSFIDVTELKNAEEALLASRSRFKDYAEVASDWFWEMDEDLRFSFFSGRNFQLTGYKPEDLIGKTRAELAKDNLEDPRWREHFEDLLARRPFRDFSYQLTTPTGDNLHISISGTPVFDGEGNFQGYRGTGADVSSQVKDKEALQEAMEEAKFANRAKTEFLANMSHELRTPLNSVIGFSDLLMDEKNAALGPDKVSEYMRDINNSGKHLLELINDILDIARIERGLLELNEKKLDVPVLMASCQRLVYDRAFDAGVELKTEAAKTLPALLADELRTKQILLNLLSNAIKFTPEGGTINFRAGIDKDECFHLSVTDTGIGIAPENIETALSDFGQVDGTLARKYDGTGLGLPLSKKLAELHGGELMIKSNPGTGTTVTVRFPSERTISLA